MTKEQRAAKKLDHEIGQTWFRLAFGVQVSMMEIPAIFRDVRTAVGNGATVDEGVEAAITKYQLNKKSARRGDASRTGDGSKRSSPDPCGCGYPGCRHDRP
jgi:hypothetical protein